MNPSARSLISGVPWALLGGFTGHTLTLELQVHFLESAIAASVSGTAALMEVTLAYFEDTGWYRARVERAGFTDFGL